VAKSLIVSINQPAYLPWLGYFERIARSDLHVVLDHVQFEKNSFVNRNKIKTTQGPTWLTVPVLTKGKFGSNPITELQIDGRSGWNKKHWKTISMNYSKTLFFERYRGFFEPMFEQDWVKLVDLNMHFIRFALQELNIHTPIVFSSRLEPQCSKSALVLELCRKSGASVYLSGMLGKDYLDEPSFREAGIRVEYQDYRHPEYTQLYGAFQPFLSVLDLLMNHGPGAYEIMMSTTKG
jgi:hypothetical protein